MKKKKRRRASIGRMSGISGDVFRTDCGQLSVCPPACGMVGDRGAVPAVGIAVSSGDCLYEIL